MSCKLCGEDKRLVKSHIIPKAMFRVFRKFPKENELELLTNTEGVYNMRSPEGVYDKTILCEDCEKIFNDCDTYASEFFLQKKFDKNPLMLNGKEVGFEIGVFNYNLLKKFGISLLWRASVSSNPFYKKVVLGPHENILREMIRKGQVGSADEYSMFLAKFNHGDISAVILDPHQIRHNNILYYRFYFASYCLEIKADKRKSNDDFSHLIIKPDQSAYVIGRDFANSNELKIIKRILRAKI